MMIGYIIGACTMLIGVIVGMGYAMSIYGKEETEEVARWQQEIDDVPGINK